MSPDVSHAGSPDVLVVGAGVIGSAIAFHAATRGLGDIEVIERDAVGSGMSSRSSALVRSHYPFLPEFHLSMRAREMFDAWPDLVGRPTVVRETGWVKIVQPGDVANLKKNVQIQRELGSHVQLVTGDELAKLAPGLRTDDIEVAAYEEHGGFGDGAVVAGDLLAAARGRGVRYRRATPIRGLVRRGGRITGVETADGAISAGVVVLATGVWTRPLLHGVGIEVPIELEHAGVAVLRHARGAGAPVACSDRTAGVYFRPEGDGHGSLVGAQHHKRSGPEGIDPDTIPASAEPEDLAGIVEAASRRVPALAEAGVARGTTGVYDMSPDLRPLLGALPGVHGLVLAAGFSGTGFKISPAVGESIAALIEGKPDGAVDISAFRPSRFDEGAPIRPTYPYAAEEPSALPGVVPGTSASLATLSTHTKRGH